LMYRREYSVELIQRTIEKRGLNGLSIFDDLDPLSSIDFLRSCGFLRALRIQCRYDHDFSFLEEMPLLNYLSIGASESMKNEIDLSAQVNLEHLALKWRKGKIRGLENCTRISDLCLIEFSEESLEPVESLMNVTRLRVKTGSIRSLKGIERLKKVKELELGYCRNLRSLGDMNGLTELETVLIESCRKILDYASLDDLPKLRSLKLINCGDIPALDYECRFPRLEEFRLLERTRLVEGL
jgi:hypothetical protein